MKKTIQEIEKDALDELASITMPEDIEPLTIKYLGRKGVLTSFLRNISMIPVDERPQAGKNANLLKVKLEGLFKEALTELESGTGDKADAIDVTLPGRPLIRGALHPITGITREIAGIFSRLGFDIAEGPR